jgi:hypothetical protein
MNMNALSCLSDAALAAELGRLARCEREATTALLVHLAEFDARRLYRGAGYDSMFTYCTGALRLSEGGAYNRIEVARAARRFPALLERMRAGELTLATARLLAPHLDDVNQDQILRAAAGQSKSEVEKLIVALVPRPDVPSSVRKRPVPVHGITNPSTAPQDALGSMVGTVPSAEPASFAPAPTPPRRPVTPLSPGRYEIRFTASEATREKLRQAQDLLRHAVPNGDPAEIFDRALTVLLEDLARKKFAATTRPGKAREHADDSRVIPAAVKRAVWLRDGGRCAFVTTDGHRCDARGFLEFHHRTPYAAGGKATVGNIELRCRSHNGYEAELYFFGHRSHPDVIRETTIAYGHPHLQLVPGQVRPGDSAHARPDNPERRPEALEIRPLSRPFVGGATAAGGSPPPRKRWSPPPGARRRAGGQ